MLFEKGVFSEEPFPGFDVYSKNSRSGIMFASSYEEQSFHMDLLQ